MADRRGLVRGCRRACGPLVADARLRRPRRLPEPAGRSAGAAEQPLLHLGLRPWPWRAQLPGPGGDLAGRRGGGISEPPRLDRTAPGARHSGRGGGRDVLAPARFHDPGGCGMALLARQSAGMATHMDGGDGGDDRARLAADSPAAADRNSDLARVPGLPGKQGGAGAGVKAGAVRIRHARIIVAAGAAIAALAILLLSRNFNFYFDEWDFILAAPDWTWLSFLQPHNEHPVVIPKLIYAALLNTFGLHAYWPYMAVLLALHATNAFLLFELVRRRSGDLIGVAAAALMLFLGAGWENLLWAFQMTFVGSVACGLGALLALQRMSGQRGIAAVVALTTASILFSGIGLFFAVAVAAQMAIDKDRRRDLLWLAPIAVALAIWYVTLGRTGTPTNPPPSVMNLTIAPVYVLWGLGAALAALIGEGGWWSAVALVPALAAIGWSWRRRTADALVMPQVNSPALYYRAVDKYGDPAPKGPVTDRTDYDRARQSLVFTSCR